MIRSKRGKKEAIIAALILVCMGLTYALFSGGTGLFCGIAEDSARGAVPLAADATTQRAAYGSIAEEAQRAALFAYAGVEPNISLTYASEDEAQGEEMASYTTSFAQSSSARVHNIALAAQALDGCKVIFCLIEWIRGKPINRKIENIIHFAGLIFLLLLAIILDLVHFLA